MATEEKQSKLVQLKLVYNYKCILLDLVTNNTELNE